ncbi:5-formyltetrahydrofolate cyclo-ligase [Saccharopolyspora cebuensis]|uniref:5-formyltetrahydrofolate cyclo-ligase n=1 Tax=Saccharopolyspora cebuensis TaxID=418759 RepID=A0ABV4CFD1_9PSEU
MVVRDAGLDAVDAAKQAVRERVWQALRDAGAARFPGARGRIPNFTGAEAAARLLDEQDWWRSARTVKANPDSPQLPVRAAVLDRGALLYVAVPELREPRPFVRLEPAGLPVPPKRAAAKDRALELGTPVAVAELDRLDVVVCGTVAVDRRGARIGKGGGFADLEFGLLVEAGLVDERTTIATTVHPLQVLDEELPETEHDFRVDVIVTPDEVLRTPEPRRGPGILWHHLDEGKIRAIPALAERR